MTIAGSLVYLRGQRGPECQKWPIGTTARARSENRDRILAEHPLNEGEFGLSICILEQRYPPPPRSLDDPAPAEQPEPPKPPPPAQAAIVEAAS